MQRRTESSVTNCCRRNPGNDTSKCTNEWQSEKKCSSFSEEILIVYFNQEHQNTSVLDFNEKARKLKLSSLWSIYSMLRVTIKLNQNIDIVNYGKLKSILKFVTKFVYETF